MLLNSYQQCQALTAKTNGEYKFKVQIVLLYDEVQVNLYI